MTAKVVGLIINPIAGIGGRVGLKGSDGFLIQQKAYELGAKPLAVKRTIEALSFISSLSDKIAVLTYPDNMGFAALNSLGLSGEVLGEIDPEHTSAADTRRAAQSMLERSVELLVFSGGDGTARDIYEAIGNKIPCLGIPAGVKIHSPVYAINPSAAGQLLFRYLSGEKIEIREAEIIDLDEESYRLGIVKTRLYGYLKVLYLPQFIQGGKVSSPISERSNMMEIAHYVVDCMEDGVLYILGPGTTIRAVTDYLGLEKTLIGVDLLLNRELIAKDVNENQLLSFLTSFSRAKIIVTPIGGQGFIFGRGNQQISPTVIRCVGKENIWILSTLDKILSLKGKPMLVDSGDHTLDLELGGYWQILIGYKKTMVYPIK